MATGTGGQRGALVFAAAATAAALYGVPSWEPSDVRVLAFAVAGATVVLLGLTRLLGTAGASVERIWIALFLAAMPVVYVLMWIGAGHASGFHRGWLAVELGGLLVFGGLAIAGLRASPWLLPAGVAAHGLAWDAWHLVTATYVPSWYALGCLVIDVGLAAYVATRLAAWQAARPVSSRS